jgi:outer membrane protein assembly factor BamD (BamD/ComL family)
MEGLKKTDRRIPLGALRHVRSSKSVDSVEPEFKLRRELSQLSPLAIVVCLVLQSGCASLNLFKKEDDEYTRARNAIEGYEDKEGNWIRPEGARADKARDSSVPKAFQFIPGLGPKPVNKELAKDIKQQADELFNKAIMLQEEERRDAFRTAAKKYVEASKHWVSSALEQDSLMMAAESYFFAEDYPKAEDYYLRVLKDYPRTRYQDRIDQRRMEIGLYWLQFKDQFYNLNLTDKKRPWNDTRNHGKRVLEKMRLDNPTGKLADDVTMRLANTAFEKENWNEALDTYRDLITTYPDSPHQFEAHVLGVKSALMSYQGADYSGEPLEKAEKMIKQMVRQFPQKAKEEQEKIQDAFSEVRYRRAERLFTQATFRYNKNEAKAARIHCTRILTEFSDTPFADKAREMMEKTGGMPDEPTQHLTWLADLFPNRDKIAPLLKPTPNVEDNEQQRSSYERTAAQPSTPTPNAFGSEGGTSKR